jgi:hypothetical protein
VTNIAYKIITVLFKIFIDLASVFSDIRALKSLSYLISSFTDAAEAES